MKLESDERGSEGTLIAQFYTGVVFMSFKSEEAGRPIYEDVDFIKIFIPGDKNNIIDRPCHEGDKQRFPQQWAHYKNQKDGDQKEIGTPITEWPKLSLSQKEELKALKFFTVESVANASDQALSKIGMIGGMSPYAFRDAAIRFLKVATDDAAVSKIESESKKEIDELKSQIEELKRLVSGKKEPAKKPEPMAEAN